MMRRLAVNTLALATMLVNAGISLGQALPPPAGTLPPQEKRPAPRKTDKSKLEEMLAEALKNNPDIRVAAANVTLAEAELNRTRLQVTQKVVALHASLASQKAEVTYRHTQYERYKSLAESKSIDTRLLQEAEQRLAIAKAKLAELESQMPALLGKVEGLSKATDSSNLMKITIGSDAGHTEMRWRLRGILHQPPGPLTDKIRKALETPIKVDYKDVKFSEVLKDLEKKAPDLSFHIRDVPEKTKIIQRESRNVATVVEATVTLHFDTPLPIAAILQAIEDEAGCAFFIRDYGILVTSKNFPPGAVKVQEFMRQKPAEK